MARNLRLLPSSVGSLKRSMVHSRVTRRVAVAAARYGYGAMHEGYGMQQPLSMPAGMNYIEQPVMNYVEQPAINYDQQPTSVAYFMPQQEYVPDPASSAYVHTGPSYWDSRPHQYRC